MSQPTLNTLDNTQGYLNQFKDLDTNHLGYLSVAQVKDYFKSQQLPEDDLIELVSHSNQGRLTPEQFASIMNLSVMKKHGDVGYHSSKFSSLLRHCEEAMKLVEKDRRMTVPSTNSKESLLKAFKAVEDFMKHFIQSLEDEPQDNDRSFNRSIAPSTREKMPGSFDSDNGPSDSSMTLDEPSVQTASAAAAAPIFLKDPSFNDDIPANLHSRQHEKEPALDLPSPLPQMNDAATDFMSGGLKPISNRNLNGDDAEPNNAHENDTLRSNVLDSLRNAALNDTEMNEDGNKEREILSEEEPRELAIPARGMPSSNATGDVGVLDSFKPTAVPPSSPNKQSSATDSKLEPTTANSGPRDINAQETIVPSVASAATVAAATALSDNNKGDSYSGNPLDTASTSTHIPETFQGDLGGGSSEPFIKNAKDTELKPKDQPSFGAVQATLNSLDGADDGSVNRMNAVTFGNRSLLPESGESNQFGKENKPFEREAFQGGLGGNGTEPYIKNEKDTLLRPEDQPSFGAVQENIRRLSEADNENGSTDNLNGTESSPSLGPTLSRMGAGAAGMAGAAALGLSEHPDANDKSKDKNTVSSPLDDAVGPNSMSPRNVYSPSLTSGNSLEGASPSDVISNEALNNIADKVDADIERDGLHGDSALLDSKDGGISSDALDTTADNLGTAIADNTVPSSAFMDVSPHEDVHVLVEQETSLPPKIGNEVDIETANNDSNRSPLSEEATLSPSVVGRNDSTAASPGLNNDYSGGSSTVPDSVYRAAPPVANTIVASNLPLNAANAPSASLPARSLTPNDEIKHDSSKDSPKDNTDSHEEKPGFFQKLFGARSKSPEPASPSNPVDFDKAASKEFTSSPADSKSFSPSSDMPIAGKIHALGNMSPNARGADGSLGSPEDNANRLLHSQTENPDDKPKASFSLPPLDNNRMNPSEFDTDVNTNNSGPSPSLENMPTDIKNLSDNVSDKFGTNAQLSSFDGSNADLPNVDSKLDSFSKLPDVGGATIPSLNADMKYPSVDLPDVDNSLNTSDLDAKAPFIDDDLKSPSFNADMERPDVSGSLSELPSLTDIKKDLSGKINSPIDTPDIHGESSFLNAGLEGQNVELSGIGAKLPSVDADLKTPDMDKSSFDGSYNISNVDGKLSSMKTNVSAPNAILPSAGGKTDRSIDAPDDVDDDAKSPGSNATSNVNTDDSTSSGSILGKLSAGIKNIKDGISGALEGSANTPDTDDELPHVEAKKNTDDADLPHNEDKLPSPSPDLETPKLGEPSVAGKLTRSMDTPTVGAKLPFLYAELKSPDSDLPNVSDKLGRSTSATDSDSNVKSSSSDADQNADNSGLSGSLSMLSAGLKNLKDDISGKLYGSPQSPNTVDGKTPDLDANIKSPSADLSNVSGTLDSSVKTPDFNSELPSVDSGAKSPAFDAHVNVDRPDLSGSLGKLSSSFEDFKKDITGSSGDTPNVDKELPALDSDLKSPDAGLPDIHKELPSLNADMKAPHADLPDINKDLPSLDTDLKTPNANLDTNISGKVGGELPSLGADMKSRDAELPDVHKELPSLETDLNTPKQEKPSLNADINDKLYAIEGGLEAPNVNVNANEGATRSSVSGLDKLSSSFKGLKDSLSGQFKDSADTPSSSADFADPNGKLPASDADLSGVKLGMPSIDGKLTNYLDPPPSDVKLPALDAEYLKKPDVTLPNVSGKLDRSLDAPEIDSDANADMDTSSLSGSLGKLSAGLKDLQHDISGDNLPSLDGSMTVPKTDVDVPDLHSPNLDASVEGNASTVPVALPQVDTHTDVPIVPPRLSRLSLNKVSSSDAHLDGSSNRNDNVPDTSSGFKRPASSSFLGDGDDELSLDDDEAHGNNKTTSGYAHLRTRSRTESPENLSATLDDIVKRRFSDTPSESDVSSLTSDKKKPASGKSRQLNAAPAGLSAGVSEPHASVDDDKPRSFVSDSRFKELDAPEADATEYSTPSASPVLPNTAAVNRPSTSAAAAAAAAAAIPTVTLDKIDDLESMVEKQLDAMSVSVGQAPQVPAHKEDQPSSPSKTHRSSASLQSTSFHDRSAADAIRSVYDHMTSKLMTGGPKSGSGTDEDRVLKVRDGFENFNGFGVKCVSDNEDDEKHTTVAP